MTARLNGPPCDEYWESLNDYVDGALAGADRVAFERHIAGCPACERAAADLAQIRRASQALAPRRPRADAWQRIAAELAKEPGTVSAPRAAARPARWVALAAAAVLVLAVSSAVYMVSRPAPAGPAAPAAATAASGTAVNPAPGALVKSIDDELKAAESHYEKAIAGLEQIAKSEEAQLDPALAATLRKNMGVIDQAIRDSRTALQAQPASELAQDSLFEALQRKVSLLEDTITLINVMRKGDQAATARIVEGTSKS